MRIMGAVVVGVLLLLAVGVVIWRGDIVRSSLDPQIPFQTYTPPPAPDYGETAAWAVMDPPAGQRVAVFFLHPTTHDGGSDWNAAHDDARARLQLLRVMVPNYAGPFYGQARIMAPHYRQASLYTRMTLREDAREARAFAYRDVVASFEAFLRLVPSDMPIMVVGVEQGAELLARLVRERIGPDASVRSRLVAGYLIDVVVPADEYGPGAAVPACTAPEQVGCVLAWSPVREGSDDEARRRRARALVWNDRGQLDTLSDRPALCVNPVLGQVSGEVSLSRQHLGGANATGMERGARPAFITRQVATQCREGILRYTEPRSEAFEQGGSWADRRKAKPYNLFYADIEADAERRLTAFIR